MTRVTEERAELERLVKGPNAYRTISEVADELHVPQHVLRFWETRFPEVKPLKRGGGRRYYSPEDIDILRHITDLLYVQGYTIKGVQRVLKEHEAPSALVPVKAKSAAVAVSSASGSAPVEITDPVVSKDTAFEKDQAEVVIPATRSSLEIPAFHAGDEEAAKHDQLSEDQVADSLADPGEETASSSDIADEEPLAQSHSDNLSHDDDTAAVKSESEIAAVLFDELVELRALQASWTSEKRALRLALEDVLGELDSLRQMVPGSA